MNNNCKFFIDKDVFDTINLRYCVLGDQDIIINKQIVFKFDRLKLWINGNKIDMGISESEQKTLNLLYSSNALHISTICQDTCVFVNAKFNKTDKFIPGYTATSKVACMYLKGVINSDTVVFTKYDSSYMDQQFRSGRKYINGKYVLCKDINIIKESIQELIQGIIGFSRLLLSYSTVLLNVYRMQSDIRYITESSELLHMDILHVRKVAKLDKIRKLYDVVYADPQYISDNYEELSKRYINFNTRIHKIYDKHSIDLKHKHTFKFTINRISIRFSFKYEKYCDKNLIRLIGFNEIPESLTILYLLLLSPNAADKFLDDIDDKLKVEILNLLMFRD